MTGGEELIRMRLEGRIPSLLYIELDVDHLPGDGNLRIYPNDPLYSLDLRGVQGLVVSIGGCDGKRVKAVASLCEEAGARRVIANIHRALPEHQFEVIEVTDTEGLFTWSKK